MKLKDVLENLDKENGGFMYPDDLGREFSDLDTFGLGRLDKLVKHDIAVWLCTDTHVGIKAIYFNDEFVAISTQTSRKANVRYDWVSVEKYKAVRDYLISLIDENGDEVITLLEDGYEDTELDMGFVVNYEQEIIDKFVYYVPVGALVKHVRRPRITKYNDISTWRTVDIECDGEVKTVPIEDVLLPYHLRDDRINLFYDTKE